MTAARRPTLHELADAIAADIANEWPHARVDRQNLPQKTLEELAALTVTVIPVGQTWESKTRDVTQRKFTIDLAIWQRLDNINPDPAALTADDLIDFATEVAEFWTDTNRAPTGHTATDTDPVFCLDGKLDADEPFDAETYREDSVFRSIVRLQFIAAT